MSRGLFFFFFFACHFFLLTGEVPKWKFGGKFSNLAHLWLHTWLHPCTSPLEKLGFPDISLSQTLFGNLDLTLKEPGFLDPSHSRGGGAGFRPPKISETDWRNIKCVVLVDSYDPPESIGTKKKSTNIPCMTPQWRHKWRHVKNKKIAKIMVFRYFFKQKLHFLAMMCVKICLHMFLLQINEIKHSESVSWNNKNIKNTICV